MTWKDFNSMVKSIVPISKQKMNLNFIEVINSPTDKITLSIPLENKPLILVKESGINIITPDVFHVPDNQKVIITFNKINTSDNIDMQQMSFSNGRTSVKSSVNSKISNSIKEEYHCLDKKSLNKKMSTTDYILFTGGLVLIGYLIYHLYYKNK
jgi:hypothetical protein